MKISQFVAAVVFLLGCNTSRNFCDKDSIVPMTRIFNNWDSSTRISLTTDTLGDHDAKGKFSIYFNSLNVVNADSIDFFDRASFLKQLNVDSIFYCSKRDKEVVIVEFSESGEKIERRKFLIVKSSSATYCYSYVKDVQGNWGMRKKHTISDYQLSFICELKNNPNSQSSTSDMWGSEINDYLLISKYDGNSLSVKTFLFLRQKELEKILKSLNG